MTQLKGFWSYVHADDDAEDGRIARLSRDVKKQFEMLTGQELHIFFDRENLEWGENWRARVDAELADVAFFVPVLTPRYFLSAECRRELQQFARAASALGVKELVLPLYYLDVPGFQDTTPSDELVNLVKSYQWEDWRELRFADPSSQDYRRAVSKLAERLAEVNAKADRAETAAPATQPLALSGGELEGESTILERLAAGEVALGQWSQTVKALTAEISTLGEMADESTREVAGNPQVARSFVGRLRVSQAMARKMTEPAARIQELSRTFSSQLYDVDQLMRTVIELAPAEAAQDENAREQLCDFFRQVRGLVTSTRVGLDGTERFLNSLQPLESLSRELRAAVRTLRAGFTPLLEAREVTKEWAALMDASNVNCPDV